LKEGIKNVKNVDVWINLIFRIDQVARFSLSLTLKIC